MHGIGLLAGYELLKNGDDERCKTKDDRLSFERSGTLWAVLNECLLKVCILKVNRQVSLTYFLSVTRLNVCFALQMLKVLQYKAAIGR